MSTHRGLTLAVLVAAMVVGACQDKIVNIIDVSRVDVSGGGGTILPGGSVQLSATPRDDQNNTLTNRSITWSSSNAAIATVNSTGLVQGLSAGNATISAQIEGVSGSASVTVNNPVPSVSSVAPNSIIVGGASQQVTVTGTNFVSTSIVLWNGQDRSTQYVSATSLKVTLTATDLTTTGSYNITVRNPTPGGGVSGASALTVANPVPAVTGLSPSPATAGAAFELTVTGTGFVATSVVLWNGQDRTTQYVNGTTLKATITAADVASTGNFNVTVRNPAPGGGTSGASALAVVYPVPVVTALDPAVIIVGGAPFELMVTGRGFVNGSVVVWNGQDRTTTFLNATTLKASITAADIATTGTFNVTVRNPAPGGGISGASAFAVTNPAPTIATLSPNTLLWGSAAFQLTVRGTNFVVGSVVRWNGQDRTTTRVSSATLTANITAADIASPALVNVTVVNPAPGGGTSTASQFITRIDPPGPTISARRYSTCAVRGNGEAYCWGLNDSGQLGDGTTTSRTAPTRVATTVPFVSIVVGDWHACGLTSWGAAYCWGTDSGLTGSSTSSTTPVPVTGGHAFIQLAAGAIHTCGVTADGGLYCWGDNWDGQLGDGTTTERPTPVAVAQGQSWRRVLAGRSHSCAITSTGRMYCWGDNYYGNLGDGTTTDRLIPAPVSGSTTFTSGAAGPAHTCALTTGGVAWCWGAGGRVGDGTPSARSVPTQVSGGLVFALLSAGAGHTCGVRASGAAYCWGDNYSGQLGTGGTDVALTPVSVNAPPLRDITAGELHSCGITTTGTGYCWGERTFGALGDGVSAVRTSAVSVGTGYTAVAAGNEFTCALSGTSPRCWGRNNSGQLGDNTYIDRTVPTTVAGGLGFSRIITGETHACGLTSTGSAYCWGANWAGQLGNGTTVSSPTPVAVTGGYRFTDLSGSGFHTCGVTAAGEVRCWGPNWDGQLGDGSNVDRTVPTLVTSVAGLTFSRVSAHDNHTCGVTTAGVLYCWGANRDGQLGDGTTTPRLTPVRIATAAPVSMVSVGRFHTCVVTTANVAYCWGFGGAGELGTGNWSSSLLPAQVAGGLAIRSIGAGAQATCAVTTTNSGYCWGWNFWGQLGIGTTSWPGVPTALASGASYQEVQVGSSHACGLTTAGAVHCWGRLRTGELGIGTSGLVLTPAPVQGSVLFSQEACAGDQCGVALLSLPARRLFAPASAGIHHLRPMPRFEPIRPVEPCTGPVERCEPVPVRIVRW